MDFDMVLFTPVTNQLCFYIQHVLYFYCIYPSFAVAVISLVSIVAELDEELELLLLLLLLPLPPPPPTTTSTTTTATTTTTTTINYRCFTPFLLKVP
jgi:hypothetical protein